MCGCIREFSARRLQRIVRNLFMRTPPLYARAKRKAHARAAERHSELMVKIHLKINSTAITNTSVLRTHNGYYFPIIYRLRRNERHSFIARNFVHSTFKMKSGGSYNFAINSRPMTIVDWGHPASMEIFHDFPNLQFVTYVNNAAQSRLGATQNIIILR